MSYRLQYLEVDGEVKPNPAQIVANTNVEVVAHYEVTDKMVKVTNQTGSNMIAVKITMKQTEIPLSNGQSVDIPFDPSQGDVEIILTPSS